MNLLHVRHVREALEREYRGLIDLSDLERLPDKHKTQAFLSRALAALAVQYLTGCDTAQAAASVIDGFDDGGFDAVVVGDVLPRLWLVQAKWSDQGKAGLTLGDPGKMRTGLDQMVNSEFDHFNSRFQAMANQVDAVISNSDVKVTLVVAQMGASTLTSRVQDVFNRILRDINGNDDMVNLEVLGLSEFHRMIRAGIAAPRIDLEARLDSPALVPTPYKAFQGILAAETVANWYQEFGHRLFDQNIRKALGVTPVNKGLIETLLSEPDHFLYFNNGITLLCESVRPTLRRALAHSAPLDLHVTGAGIVNGAQTVASIHEAMKVDPNAASRARVWARLISLEDCPEDFAIAVTRATNTQNRINLRDFVSLDATQLQLRDEFALSLRKTYVIKRGETDPEPSTGCTVDEATVALACVHPNIEYMVRARHDTEVLYETGEQGAYPAIFGKKIHAYRTWRAVQLARCVRSTMDEMKEEIEGRAAQIATQGDLLITHLISRRIGQRAFDDIDHSWETESLPLFTELSRTVLLRLIHRVDAFFPRTPIHMLFKNRERVGTLVQDILNELVEGTEEPALSEMYRATPTERRLNAVAVIVDGNMIADGTVLEFRPGTGPQRRLFAPWLSYDSKRGRASWINDRAKPLIWELDRKQYSPDGLVRHMTSLLTDKPSSAGQGVRRWFVPGRGCLVDIASASVADE